MFVQLTNDFEDIQNEVREEAKRQHLETTKTLKEIQQHIVKIKTKGKTAPKQTIRALAAAPPASPSYSQPPIVTEQAKERSRLAANQQKTNKIQAES